MGDITQILQAVEQGENSGERLLPLVYDELRKLAAHKLAHEAPGQTLQATALGLKNLDRVVDILVPATTQLGEDYSLLEETYKSTLSHRARWFGAVATMVGGVVETRSLAGRGSESFTRITKEKQQEAVRFLVDHAFIVAGGEITKAARNWLGGKLDVSKRSQAMFKWRSC